MRQVVARYSLELLILLLSAVAGGLEALFAKQTDIALVLWLLGILLSLAVISVRHEIDEQVGEALADRQWISRVPDDRWRLDARNQLELVRAEFASWASGTRRVPADSSLNYQISSLRSTTTSVRAIHLAFEPEARSVWLQRQKGFHRLVDAYRALPAVVRCRRIVVLDKEDRELSLVTDGRHIIIDETVVSVCQSQSEPRPDGLGFDVRIAWRSTGDRSVGDVLILDDRECCSIENQGRGHFSDLEVSINQSVVQHEITRFEDLWTASAPWTHCLPDATS